MEVSKYLGRIHYVGTPSPTLETLMELQKLHQMWIPWENLDVVLQRNILMDLPRLYQKIVVDKRGGFCHEQNGLFGWLLQKLGYEVVMCNSRSRITLPDGSWQFQPDFDHMALVVTVGKVKYLVDVGWGQIRQPFRPLELKDGNEVELENGDFHLRYHQPEDLWYLEFKQRDEIEWAYVYVVSLRPRCLEEFQAGVDYQEKGLYPNSMIYNLPTVMVKTHNGTGAKLFLKDKFRHYTDIHLSPRCTIEEIDNIPDADLAHLLSQHFDLPHFSLKEIAKMRSRSKNIPNEQ